MSCCGGSSAGAKPGKKQSTGKDQNTRFKTIVHGNRSISIPEGASARKALPPRISDSGSGSGSGSDSFSGSSRPPDYNDVESDMLQGRDFIFLVDRSFSMKNRLKNGITRLKACEEVLYEMVVASEKYDHDGPTLIPFSKKTGYETYENVTAETVVEIFQTLEHSSGSHLAEPLAERLQMYLDTRRAGGKKLLIVIFHDGEPANKVEVIKVIKRFTQHLDTDDEVGITFIQATDEYIPGEQSKANEDAREALEFFTFLDDHLQQEDEYGPAAKFDIVDTKSINDIIEKGAKYGFVQALID